MSSNNETTINKLEQGRAKYAYECVSKAITLFGENYVKEKKIIPSKLKEYKSYSKKIPMMIKVNGLGASLCFIKSKSSGYSYNDDIKQLHKKYNAYDLLHKQITDWFINKENERYWIFPFDLEAKNDLIEYVIELESPDYRAVTNEVISLLSWLKCFADGKIKELKE